MAKHTFTTKDLEQAMQILRQTDERFTPWHIIVLCKLAEAGSEGISVPTLREALGVTNIKMWSFLGKAQKLGLVTTEQDKDHYLPQAKRAKLSKAGVELFKSITNER